MKEERGKKYKSLNWKDLQTKPFFNGGLKEA
jgi:hypothetical protein